MLQVGTSIGRRRPLATPRYYYCVTRGSSNASQINAAETTIPHALLLQLESFETLTLLLTLGDGKLPTTSDG